MEVVRSPLHCIEYITIRYHDKTVHCIPSQEIEYDSDDDEDVDDNDEIVNEKVIMNI